MDQINDPDVLQLVAISEMLKADYIREGAVDPWSGSPFAWIKTLRSRQIGKVGEQLIAGYFAARGLAVGASGDSEADRVISGYRVEIKMSTLWASGLYKFQQIRDQKYDCAILLGLSPFDVHCWVVSKSVLRENVIGKMGQHRGKAGTDTDWLSVKPDSLPDWLEACGGTLRAAFECLREMGVK